jgi:hypothetical protein
VTPLPIYLAVSVHSIAIAIRRITTNIELTFIFYHIAFRPGEDSFRSRLAAHPDRHGNFNKFTFDKLKKHAIKLCVEQYTSTQRQDFIDLYNIDFYYDKNGYRASITSDEDLLQVSRQFKRKGEVVIFANLVKKKKKKALESPTLESAATSSTSTVHSATPITTPETSVTSPFLIKLALAGSGGKKVDSTYRFPKAKH